MQLWPIWADISFSNMSHFLQKHATIQASHALSRRPVQNTVCRCPAGACIRAVHHTKCHAYRAAIHAYRSKACLTTLIPGVATHQP